MERLHFLFWEVSKVNYQDHSVPERQIFPSATAITAHGHTNVVHGEVVAYYDNTFPEENRTLTEDQYWYLRLAGLGLTNGEISQVMGVSEHIVRHEFSRILDEFNAYHRDGAVVGAITDGILNLDDLIEGRDFARYDHLKDKDKMLLDAYTASWQEKDMTRATANLIGRANQTVKNRLCGIYKVLGVRNNTEAVVYNLEIHRRRMREAVPRI